MKNDIHNSEKSGFYIEFTQKSFLLAAPYAFLGKT